MQRVGIDRLISIVLGLDQLVYEISSRSDIVGGQLQVY